MATFQKLFTTAGGTVTGATSFSADVTFSGTNSLLLSDGAAGSPRYTFTDDQDTGMFRPSNNALAFTTGGTERLNISDTGVATFSSSIVADGHITLTAHDKLRVVGNTENYVKLYDSSGAMTISSGAAGVDYHMYFYQKGAEVLRFSGGNATFKNNIIISDTEAIRGNSDNSYFDIYGGVNYLGGHIRLYGGTSGGTNAGYINFYSATDTGSNWTPAVQIKPDDSTCFNGSVGIGTTSAGATLEVKGTDGDNATETVAFIDTNGNHNFTQYNGGKAVFNYGPVGIGTTSPDGALHVKGGAWGKQLVLQNNNEDHCSLKMLQDDGQVIGYLYGTTDSQIGLLDMNGNWLYHITYDESHKWLINNSQKMHLNSSGRLGIGTTSPSAMLHVKGGGWGEQFIIQNNNADHCAMKLMQDDGQAIGYVYGNTDGQIGFLDMNGNWIYHITYDESQKWFINNSEKMRLDSNGDLGIGTTNPTEKLTVNGTMSVSGNATLSSNVYFNSTIRAYVESDILKLEDNDQNICLMLDDEYTHHPRGIKIGPNSAETADTNITFETGNDANSQIIFKEESTTKWTLEHVCKTTGANQNSLTWTSADTNITQPAARLTQTGKYVITGDCVAKRSKLGVIAQEIEKVIPSAVREEERGKTVDYIQIIPMLVESIKELKQEVDTLKNKCQCK